MNIEQIVQTLNDESHRFEFGQLQDMRKQHLGLNKKPVHTPFGKKTVFDHYAYHVGGRHELQFNVGFDNDDLRWGVAVSLKSSRRMRDVSELFPKLDKLNEFIRVHADGHLRDFVMWDWYGNDRSNDRLPSIIAENLYSHGFFLFLGRHQRLHRFDVAEAEAVLRDFDRLLPVYKFVEFEESTFPRLDKPGFTFRPNRGAPKRRYRTEATWVSTQIGIALHHGRIQDALEQQLRYEVGDQVATEHADGIGGRVDAIAQRGDDLEFYEIKVGHSARSCIRQAIGQLLEYGFWPGGACPAKLFVVGEPHLDREAEEYLEGLRNEFSIPIHYRQILIEN